ALARTSPVSASCKPRWEASGFRCSRRSRPGSSGPQSCSILTPLRYRLLCPHLRRRRGYSRSRQSLHRFMVTHRSKLPESLLGVLSDSGVVGELISHSPLKMEHLGRVNFIGAVCGDCDETLNIRQFRVTNSGGTDRNAPVYLIIGTSSSVGKTTAGV